MAGGVVVVAVSPRLLSDAVRRTLDLDGISTADLDGGDDSTGADVAVVSEGREVEVRARTVITLTGSSPVPARPPAGVRVGDVAELRAALAQVVPRDGC